MNIYYSPEKYGLSVVGEAEALGGYEFDTFVVWTDPDTGRYFWDEDSGCSCPTPFEGMGRDTVRQGTARDALTDLRAWAGQNDYSIARREAASRTLAEKLEAAS